MYLGESFFTNLSLKKNKKLVYSQIWEALLKNNLTVG